MLKVIVFFIFFLCISLSLFAGIRLLRTVPSTKFASNLIKNRYYSKQMDPKLEAVPLVDIDDEGRFKYILIKVYGKEMADGSEPSKLIVRGYKRAQWHGNSFNIIESKLFYSECESFKSNCIFISGYI